MRMIDADALRANLPRVDMDLHIMDIKRRIDRAPTVDAMPVVRGEWIPAKDPYDRVYCYRHAGCGCEHNEQSAYCPACGAKMK